MMKIKDNEIIYIDEDISLYYGIHVDEINDIYFSIYTTNPIDLLKDNFVEELPENLEDNQKQKYLINLLKKCIDNEISKYSNKINNDFLKEQTF